MLSLILGLGNEGARYVGTRHNVGFDVTAQVAQSLAAHHQPQTQHYRWCRGRIDGNTVVLAWPTTYMNRSGLAARALLERLELEPTRMLVVVDDYNLNLGALRFRRDGSDGGHNGLASIIDELGTDRFPRLRVGIGPAPQELDKAEFVLRRFEADEIETRSKMISDASEAVILALKQSLEDAMTVYNHNPARS
ncbi:MAG: aminoacyl-tRNA hydrolase [bacterium]